jgi:hypothetical protein
MHPPERQLWLLDCVLTKLEGDSFPVAGADYQQILTFVSFLAPVCAYIHILLHDRRLGASG